MRSEFRGEFAGSKLPGSAEVSLRENINGVTMALPSTAPTASSTRVRFLERS